MGMIVWDTILSYDYRRNYMEHYVTDIKTLKEEKVMQVEVLYRMILLILTEDEIYAIEDRCPHLGISLSTGKIVSDTIKCKDHGLAISLKSGQVISENQANYLRLDTTNRQIKTYPVVVKQDKVYLRL